MKTNIINWFRLINWHEFNFQYRLVDVQVEGAGNDTKQLNKAFFNALNHLAYSTKGPVSFAYHQGKRYIAVKSDAILKYEIIPGSPLNIILTPLEGQFFLNSKTMDEKNLNLALRFLESAINWQFNNYKGLWDGGINTFLKKIPLQLSNDIETDIYHGFKFKLVAEDSDNVFFCVDLAYRYADKKTLHELLQSIPQERHNDLIYNRNFLYLNGDNWYTVKGKSVGNPIYQHQLAIGRGISVYDYIVNEGKYRDAVFKAPLFKNSPTFFHGYNANAAKTYAGAACLAKRIRFAEDDLHKNSINEPNKRFMRAELHVKNYFQKLRFNGVQLQVDTKPYKKECNVFTLPSLKYGQNAILDPYKGNVKYGEPLDHFPKRRREFIYNHRIINTTPFASQHIFFPDDMPLSFGKGLKYYFEKGMKQIAPHFPAATLHQYAMKSIPFAHMVFAELKQYIEKNNLTGSSILFVLPENSGDGGRFNKALRHVVKKELFSTVKIKCVSASKLQRYLKLGVNEKYPLSYAVPDALMRNFKSYLSNTLFEYLIINRKWPFSLEKNLHHDLYIGIDAHDFYAGFCFFFGNGEKIVFDIDEVAKSVGSFRNEKINYKIISDKIVAVLSRHLKVSDFKPRSIVILRDGVSYGEEEKALVNALERLTEMKLIDKNNVQTGVIDVAKSSAVPVRAASFTLNGRSLVNPACGTHFYMNKTDAFIFNTGYPYDVPGSSNPIHVSFSSGNIDFTKALEDVFVLTQIAFSSPDRPTSLPLPLKLIDTLIRDVAHENDLATTTQKEINIPQPAAKLLKYE
jgi:hypothetical protein